MDRRRTRHVRPPYALRVRIATSFALLGFRLAKSARSAIHAIQHHSEGRSAVIVRVPKKDEVCLTTALDAGAAAIVIPHVETVEEVEEFIAQIYYRMCSLNHSAFYSLQFLLHTPLFIVELLF